MQFGRGIGELGEGGNGVSNVGASGGVGIQQFTKQSAAGKTHFGGEGGMFGSVFRKPGVVYNAWRSDPIRGKVRKDESQLCFPWHEVSTNNGQKTGGGHKWSRTI